MTYDDVLIDAEKMGLIVKEKPLRGNDGRIKGKRVAIRKDLPTLKHKACVLAEEIGHYMTSAGDITSQDLAFGCQQIVLNNRKQEYRARRWGCDYLIGIDGLIRAANAGCRSMADTAEYLDVTEEYLAFAMEDFHGRYGISTIRDNFYIQFEPYFMIVDLDAEI